MHRYIASIALFSLMVADARRSRTVDNLDDDPEGVDLDNIIHRSDKPTGLEACDNEQDEESQFIRWTTVFGREYKKVTEWKERKENWKKFNRRIRENNRASETSGNPTAPFMDHNPFSDLSEDELHKMLGHQALNFDPNYDSDDEEDDGRNLAVLKDKKINYDQSVVGPVQDQGQCGSCWAFAASTPLEGTIVLRQRKADKKAAEEAGTEVTEEAQWRGLSKQHQVDCTYRYAADANVEKFGWDSSYLQNYGCMGGRQDWTWNFLKKYGAMWDDDYRKYDSGSKQIEGTCEHENKKKAVKVKDWFQTKPDAWSIRKELQKAPLSIAIGVGNNLYGYTSGVIPKGDESWCTQQINHAVTLVGYTPGDESYVEDKEVPQCRRKTKKDADGCRKAGEYQWTSRYCCKDVMRTVTTSNGVWKIQNSWSDWWGDQGYVYAEFDDEGRGFCGMHEEVYRVEPNMKTLKP